VRGVYLMMAPAAWFVLVPLAHPSLISGIISSWRLSISWDLDFGTSGRRARGVVARGSLAREELSLLLESVGAEERTRLHDVATARPSGWRVCAL
jgi:hypothetical protein